MIDLHACDVAIEEITKIASDRGLTWTISHDWEELRYLEPAQKL